MRNFIWSGNLDQKELVTVAWKNCCKGLKEGGLGLKSLSTSNVAINLHMCCNFVKGNQSWLNLLASHVKRINGIISYNIKSSIWISIKESYNTFMESITWIIVNGTKVTFWIDTWTDEPLAYKFKITVVFHKILTTTVKDWLIWIVAFLWMYKLLFIVSCLGYLTFIFL